MLQHMCRACSVCSVLSSEWWVKVCNAIKEKTLTKKWLVKSSVLNQEEKSTSKSSKTGAALQLRELWRCQARARTRLQKSLQQKDTR